MASPVSSTNVLEKTLTARPARKPTKNNTSDFDFEDPSHHRTGSVLRKTTLSEKLRRMRYVPARLPPESCLISSGSSQSSDSAAARLVAGEEELGREEAGRASRRMGWRWCWRWARTRPVERPRVIGAAVRRRAARQRVAVAILLFW